MKVVARLIASFAKAHKEGAYDRIASLCIATMEKSTSESCSFAVIRLPHESLSFDLILPPAALVKSFLNSVANALAACVSKFLGLVLNLGSPKKRKNLFGSNGSR